MRKNDMLEQDRDTYIHRQKEYCVCTSLLLTLDLFTLPFLGDIPKYPFCKFLLD